MTPKHFAALAAAAAVCLAAALVVYSSSVPWSRATPHGAPLFANLQSNPPPKLARIEVEQGGDKLTLEHKGNNWLLKQHEGYPATPEKVRAFLVGLTEAQLVEAKTNRKDRYHLLALEDPMSKGANSRLVKLIDDDGNVVAQAVIGKKRSDAFGSGKSGTYVRRPDETQTWLVNTEIDAGTGLSDWVKSRLFEARSGDIKHVTVHMPGKDDVDIELAANGVEHLLQNIPDGMKVKYANSIGDIVDAVGSFDLDDVKKLDAPPAADKVSTVTVDLKSGLSCVFTIRPDGGIAWLTLAASGEGDAKKSADALMARTKGWQFSIPKSKADAILKTRDELLEKIAS